jgi:hypothetical protein
MSRHGVAVPADVDLADKVLWGLTVRQVALLAPVALVLLAAWRALLGTAPILVLLVATAPVAALAIALALVRVDAVGLDRLAWAAIRAPRGRLVPGEPESAAHGLLERATGRRVPAAKSLRSPVRDVGADGVIEVGPEGFAIALDVGFTNFTLRGAPEQASLVGAFARLLNAVDAHLQIISSARPVDLGDHLAALDARCAELEAGPLAEAGRAHRAWMDRLVSQTTLLRREITVIVRAAHPDGADYAARQVEACAQAIGVDAHRLDGAEIAARCRYAVDPFGTATTRTTSTRKEHGHGTR